MTALFQNTKARWLGLVALLVAVPLVGTLPGCTDLDTEPFGIVTPDQFYRTDAEILAGLAPIYAQLRASLWAYHNLSQVSSDESIVPTRGSDWFDNGRWLAIHRHTWDPSLVDLNDAWVGAYTGIARANGLLQILEEAGNTDAELQGEIRALRAYYYYELLDLFGRVPVVGDDEFTVDDENPPPNEARAFVYDFIVSELEAVRNDLPATRGDQNQGRLTRGSVEAMLANLYLNSAVFRADAPNAGGPNPCDAAACQQALNLAEGLINSGNYALADDWFSNFSTNNSASPEFLFVVQHDTEDGLGMNFPMRALHYNQFSPSPWNGFSTLAETYNAFDDDDARKNIFLAGQAINYFTGEDVDNRQGEDLIFTPEISDVENASEGEGVRILKFPPDLDAEGGSGHSNDYAFFRLGEMYLIAAEAENELNGPTQKAIDYLNALRARVFEPDEPLQLADYPTKEALRDAILQERLFELTYEAKRRQDLIRHGKFTAPWEFKQRFDPHLVLFPIPQTQLDSNPNMTQNAGY